jgi:hypothetical protein
MPSEIRIPVRDYLGLGPSGRGFGDLTEGSRDFDVIEAPAAAGVDRPLFNSTLLADMNSNDPACIQSIARTSNLTYIVLPAPESSSLRPGFCIPGGGL